MSLLLRVRELPQAAKAKRGRLLCLLLLRLSRLLEQILSVRQINTEHQESKSSPPAQIRNPHSEIRNRVTGWFSPDCATMPAMKFLLSLPIVLITAVTFFAQSQKTITVDGVITNREGQVVGGLNLLAIRMPEGAVDERSKQNRTTNINGRFQFDFTPGEYVITANPTEIYSFRAQLKIVADGVNPDDVRFTVDTSRVCCMNSNGEPFPKLTSAPRPAYPAAARAVRAHGQVFVKVTINENGSVAKAEAIGGHPLLQAAALAAARGSRFEPSDRPEREGRIIYLFRPENPDPEPGLTRYQTSLTVEVVAQPMYVNTSVDNFD